VLLQAADPEAQIKTYVNGVACMLTLDFNKEKDFLKIWLYT
jgi:hypothetical protein